MKKIISFSDVHPRKPDKPMISTDEGMSIRQSDVHPQNPQTSSRGWTVKK
jgi:hypothetical protein